MKKFLVTLVICMFFSGSVFAEENLILNQYNDMEIDSIFSEAYKAFPEFDGEKIIQMLSQGSAFDSDSIFDALINYVFKNIRDLTKACILIITIGYIISIIHATGEAFAGMSAQAAFVVGYCVFAGVIVAVFAEIVSPAKEAVESLVTMIKAVIPTLLTLITFSGGIYTSSLMSPVLVSMINVIAAVLGNFLFSIIMATVALSVSDRMSDRINVSTANKSIKQFVRWVLMFCMAIYSGIYGVYGLAGTALDSRIGKATRFAVGSSVPIVGGVVSDSLEVILSTVSAVKSITGVVGIIAICAVAVIPLIRTALVMWMLRLCAAILEPVSDKRIVQLTGDIADSVAMIFSILISVSLLFIGCIGIILISGNFIS